MPDVIVIVATLAIVAATAAMGWMLAGVRPARREAAMAVLRAETRHAEVLRLQRAEENLEQVQRFAEAAVSGGTQVVRTVHQGIAAIPFGLLESIPATRDTTRAVRKTHDVISDSVYGTIGAVNKGIGSLLRSGRSPPPVGGETPSASAPAPEPSPEGTPQDKE